MLPLARTLRRSAVTTFTVTLSAVVCEDGPEGV